jgi:hypothetical protein
VDHQIGGVHKAFEAIEPQLGKAHRESPDDSVNISSSAESVGESTAHRRI